jgi:hypothetical protein
MKGKKGAIARSGKHGYDAVLAGVVRLVEAGRSAAARSVNAVMTATYWAIGRSIVEQEQKGARRAKYGEELVVLVVARPSGPFRTGLRAGQLVPDEGVLPRLPRHCPDRVWSF